MPPYSSKANKPGHYSAYPRDRPAPRRIWRYTAAGGCLILLLLFLTSSPTPAIESAAQQINPFGPLAHQPSDETNSTSSGGIRWYNHWKWLNPFSDSITDDDNQSVLPPPRKRPPIYTYYDADAEKDKEVRAAEKKLLTIWRRAWWAQGFRPIILSKAEAMKNPLYERFQVRKTESTIGAELMRWLAWGQMGSGILSNWLTLPMGPCDDHLLFFLRRGEYPKLTRYEDLGAGLFSGEKASVEAALTEALDSPDVHKSKSFLDLVSSKTFSVDSKPKAIAYYDSTILSDQYKAVSATLTDSKATGLISLANLINSHLHLTFLNTFSSGIAILAPHRPQSLLLQYPAFLLANALISCPQTPLPTSCPPNALSKCKPCSSSSKPLPITTPPAYTNSTTTFTIATLPHPYTLASLLAKTKLLSIPHIRRHTARDPWLVAITSVTLGLKLGGPDRLVPFKEIVAGEGAQSKGLWFVAEDDDHGGFEQEDLEFAFGFALPGYMAAKLSDSKLTTAAITETLPSSPSSQTSEVGAVGAKELAHQRSLFLAAKEILKLDNLSSEGGSKLGKLKDKLTRRRGKKKKGRLQGTEEEQEKVRRAVEAWSLADMEAWRFVRSFGSRGKMERRKWEEEEK
ncbi:MAG: hypothetical protein Q9220_006578 [cf. Caloplaca sp. 1 TL-2023]